MNYLERNNNETLLHTIISSVILFASLWFAASYRNYPFSDSYIYLANLKSLLSGGSLIFDVPVVGTWIMAGVVSVTGDVMAAYYAYNALVYSVMLHLAMLFFRKEKWLMNHYLSVYMIAFIPYFFSHGFDGDNSVLAFAILFLLLHFVRAGDNWLILVPFGLFALFLTGLDLFILNFSLLLVYLRIKNIESRKAHSSVFFKRKDFFLYFIIIYIVAVITFIIYAASTGFFDGGLLNKMLHASVYLFAAGALLVANFLLGSEKELNNRVSTVILLVGTAILAYYSVNRLADRSDLKKLSGIVRPADRIFADKNNAAYNWFTSGESINYRNLEEAASGDYILLNDVWAADRKDINENFRITRRTYFLIDERSILVRKLLFDAIITRNIPVAVALKARELKSNWPVMTPEEKYNRKVNSILVEKK